MASKSVNLDVFSSNGVRLSWKCWLIVVALLLAKILGAPMGWGVWEKFDPPPAFRVPYNLSDDYFLYDRWAAYAASHYPAVVIGDSFVWGEYTPSTDTLSQSLNRAIGKDAFANLGLNGLHPAAAEGLMRYHGKSLSGKHVLLQYNPLWMQSPELDLRGDGSNERFRPQHPKLLAQFCPWIRCYKASLTERVSAVAERYLRLIGLRQHMKAVYFGKMSTAEWVLKNPYACPFRNPDPLGPFIQKSSKAHSLPESWTKKGITAQDYPWVQLDESYEWACFQREIDLLRSRGSQVFVLLGPFNPYIMTPKSLALYKDLRAKMEASLKAKDVPYWLAPDLASERYNDASHVGKEGYAEIAQAMAQDAGFRKWLETMR